MYCICEMCVGSMENGQAINPLYVISHPLVHAAKQANDKTAIFFLIKKYCVKNLCNFAIGFRNCIKMRTDSLIKNEL